MFDLMFMHQKRNETALFIWTAPHGPFIHSAQSSTADLFTRLSLCLCHMTTKQLCEKRLN